MKISLMIASLLFVSNLASAAVLLEPGIGYDIGTTKATFSGIDEGGTTGGLAYVLRLGYKFPSPLWIAFDYDMSSGKHKFSGPAFSSHSDADVSRASMGLTFGADMTSGWRFWAGYTFSSTYSLKYNVSGAASDKQLFKGGSGFKAGFGYKVAKNVALNLEYWEATYKKYNNGSATGADVDIDRVYSEYKPTGVTLLASFPFNF